MSELRGLTGARGVAAWWVVLYHLRLHVAAPGWAEAAMARGYLAVDFFFLLSGFVIWLVHAEQVAAQGWRAVPGFWWRRVARIWPLHLLMLGVAVVLAVALQATGRGDPARFGWSALPAHLLLLQIWTATPTVWNTPAWSISAELAAYLLFPLLAMAIDWRRWRSTGVLLAGASLFAAVAAAMHVGGLTSLAQAIPRWGAVRCVAEFTAGTGVAALWLRWRDRPAMPAMSAIVLFVSAIAAWCSGVAGEPFAVLLAFAALLLALALYANHKLNPLAGRAAHWLGEMSFATYLAHSLLWKLFTLVAVQYEPVPGPLVALYLLLVLLASALLHARVERPAQRWLHAHGPERSTARRIPHPWTRSFGATTAGPASPASRFAANGRTSPPTAPASPIAPRSTG